MLWSSLPGSDDVDGVVLSPGVVASSSISGLDGGKYVLGRDTVKEIITKQRH